MGTWHFHTKYNSADTCSCTSVMISSKSMHHILAALIILNFFL